MPKKPLLIAAAVVVCAAIVTVAFSQMAGQHSVAITNKRSVPEALATAIAYDNSSALYANPTALALYNLKSGTSTSFGPEFSAGSATDVHSLALSADKKYVLFRAELAQEGSLLATTLQQAGLATDLGYWWVFDVAAARFYPIPQPDATIAKIDGDHVHVLDESDNGSSITTYELHSLKKTSTVQAPAAVDFFALTSGFLLQTSENKVYFTKDGVVNRLVQDATVVNALTSDRKQAIGVHTEKGTAALIAINTTDWTVREIASNVSGEPSVLNSTAALYYKNNGSEEQPNNDYFVYTFAADRTDHWKFSGAAGTGKLSYIPQQLFAGNRALVSDSSGNYFVVGNDLR